MTGDRLDIGPDLFKTDPGRNFLKKSALTWIIPENFPMVILSTYLCRSFPDGEIEQIFVSISCLRTNILTAVI